MHARPRRTAPLLPAVLAVVAVLAVLAVALTTLLLTTAGSASAAPRTQAPTAAAKACIKPPPRNDDTIHIQGCLNDQRKKPPAPVPDAKISVEDSSGKAVGKGTSNASGVFDIPLPGKSIDNLGNTFTVKIDESSLPKGTALRNPRQVSLKVSLKLDSDVFVTFPIGNDSGASTSTAVQGLQLAVGGLVFALCLAMAAL